MRSRSSESVQNTLSALPYAIAAGGIGTALYLLRQNRELRRSNEELAQDQQNLRRRHDDMEKEIVLDPKTRLLHSEAFKAEVAGRAKRAANIGKTSALVFGDLDNFQALNHLLGNTEVDTVALKPAAKAIEGAVRQKDLIGGIVGRHGGEEFVGYLEGADAAGARIACERIQTDVNAIQPIPGQPLGITLAYTTFQLTPELGIEGVESIIGSLDKQVEAFKHTAVADAKNQIFAVEPIVVGS
ncbi:MAG TPA: GGDEF domain-containing protein [Candidatus Saccharimonadales bacterium]|nr:GGDEF domain-containing protein [Candidatus Saccharimonadales bacterium]